MRSKIIKIQFIYEKHLENNILNEFVFNKIKWMILNTSDGNEYDSLYISYSDITIKPYDIYNIFYKLKRIFIIDKLLKINNFNKLVKFVSYSRIEKYPIFDYSTNHS